MAVRLFITCAVILVSLPAQAQDAFHVFPQIADGYLPDGTYFRSTLAVIPWFSDAVTCNWAVYGLTLSLDSGQTGTSFSLNIAGNGYVVHKTTGSMPLRSGYSTLSCTDWVDAMVIYTFHAGDGSKLSEATVFSSDDLLYSKMIIDQRGGEQLGLGIANDSDINSAYRLTLRTAGGTTQTATINVAARRNVAEFVNLWLPAAANTIGVLEIESVDRVAFYAVGLRFTGAVFTTIPIR
jgi:hypothetical protein